MPADPPATPDAGRPGTPDAGRPGTNDAGRAGTADAGRPAAAEAGAPPTPGVVPADPLAEVRRHRRQVDLARKALESGCDARSEHSQLSVHATGARRVLEAAVRRAAADPGVDPEDLSAASGLSRAQLAALAAAGAGRG